MDLSEPARRRNSSHRPVLQGPDRWRSRCPRRCEPPAGMSWGEGYSILAPRKASPTPNSFTKQEPQGRKGGEAAGAQDVGRKGGGMGREHGASDCRREGLSRPSPGYPEPQGPQVLVRGSGPLDALTVPPAAGVPVLSRPAVAPCPSSGSRRHALPPRCRWGSD